MAYHIHTELLSNGTMLSMTSIEIMSIPDVTITSFDTEQDARKAYASDLTRTLSSVYDIYKASTQNASNNLAIELVWVSVPVEYQTYAAQIRLIVLMRGVSTDKSQSETLVSQATNAIAIMLEIDKYSFIDIGYDNFQNILQKVNFESKQSIVRVVRSENFPIPSLPSCMHFDCMDIATPPLEILANVLTKVPNTMVSFQLIPTIYTNEEKQYVSGVSQTLETLATGIHDTLFGAIPIVAAQKCVETYTYYHRNTNKPLFAFNASVYGSTSSAGMVSFAVQSVMSGMGKTALRAYSLEDVSRDTIVNSYCGNPWNLAQHLQSRYPATKIRGFDRQPHLISFEEAVTLMSLPIGGKQISAGLTIDRSQKQGKEYRASMVNSGDLMVGRLKSTGGMHHLGILRDDLAKHMLIVGTPGSGKTTFSIGMLDKLWKQGVPFLVIEPAKNEYRALVQSIPDLQVFTPGKNRISPFVFNPFVVPDNVYLESYKSTLKTAFAAGVSMTTPLDKIFEETINNCYADYGWLDTYTSSDKGQIFNISDFIKCFQQTFNDIGYTGDARNIGRAGIVRLQSLVNLFENYYSIPIQDLLRRPTVIELAAVENSDEKALIIALLLLSILSYVNGNYTGDSKLRNVILLEEAHVLLDAHQGSGQGEANPSAIAQQLVKRMLAELRSYGISLVIADQSPKKVTSDVVALTDVKLAFRIIEETDKQIIANSTNMSEQQIARLSRLRPGEAFFFFNKLEEPEEVITENYRLENKIAITLTDAEIAGLSTYWQDKKELLRPYPECRYARYCDKHCDYNRRIRAREIARRIVRKYILNVKPEHNTLTAMKQAQIVAVNDVFAKRSTFSTLIRQEANGEAVSSALINCVKVHLIRRIKYETLVHISENSIKNILEGK